MRSDIPRLMAERNLDAIVVSGNTDTSTDLAYLTGGAKLEGALYLQRRDAAPVLYVWPIERELAERTGIPIRLWSDFDLPDYLARHNNERLPATVAMLGDLLREHGVSGRVGYYGSGDIGASYQLLKMLGEANPHIEIVGEYPRNLFYEARETKDAAELAAMRRVGVLTCEVIDSVKAFLSAQEARGVLVNAGGNPVTIGDVKALIRMELARRNLEELHENIFTQGRDAGVPHNTGDPAMPLRIGEPIIFDIFPRDRATGYFHDITRTFFLGVVPEAPGERLRQVQTIFDHVVANLRVGEACSTYQAMTCEFFEDLGYPTLRTDSKTQVGYCHSLGHGVGLDIHEGPHLNLMPDNHTTLRPGHVITVEPGLYYPDEGWGMRIEDTLAFDADGALVNLTNYSYDPLIPVSGAA